MLIHSRNLHHLSVWSSTFVMTKFKIYVLVLFMIVQSKSFAFGNICTYADVCLASRYTWCGFLGLELCTAYRSYTCYHQACCSGWTGHQCRTPICNATCLNGGTCIGPNRCKCPSSHTGNSCETSLCSHLKPCYPGTCSEQGHCNCFHGFTDPDQGCLTFSRENNPPTITECKITLARIRRTDQKELFYYNISCSNGEESDTVWCNQALFKYAKFSMKSLYPIIPNLPPAPAYVTSHGFGIVGGWIHVLHTKYPKGNLVPHVAIDTDYTCTGFSDTFPKTDVASCEIFEQNHDIHIDHGDILKVEFSTKTGGYRDLYDVYNQRLYAKQNYTGQTIRKSILLKFDSIAPIHCSEPIAKTRCSGGEQPINIGNDITKDPIRITWDGWSDTLSGIASYHVEVFKLEPNIHGDLTELEPLKPIYTFMTNRTSSINFPTYYPPRTGMYSILLQASDKANNSKIARRLVLYDNDSSITLTKPGFLPDKPINASDISIGDGGMHVTSAIPETGYMWQTSENGTNTHIVINWENHFVNKIYDTGKLLNRVLKYPTQFEEFQDNGVLIRSKKSVNLTDNEGARTLSAISNKHGIVKFEINRVYTDDRQVPTDNWIPHDLTEQCEIKELLSDGSHVRLWIRATDIMNHSLSDYTEVHIDNTPPRVTGAKLQKNVQNGTFTHTSRLTFFASDDGSGVHRMTYKLFVGNSSDEQGSGITIVSRNNASDTCVKDPTCYCVLNTCFLPLQTLDIDNCWFLVPKEYLNNSGRIEVTVYNQALLTYVFSINITRLTDLRGLEEYSGPTNIRVEKNIASGVRLVWDPPKTASCYGLADIEVVLVNIDESIRVVKVYNEGTSVDLVGLNPDQDYKISLNLGYRGTELAALPFSFKTAPRENDLSGVVIAGIAVGVLVIFGLMIAVFVGLLRRGQTQPVGNDLYAMSVEYRKGAAGFRERVRDNDEAVPMPSTQPLTKLTYVSSTPRTKSLVDRQLSQPIFGIKGVSAPHSHTYNSLRMCGEMDFSDIQKWQIGRNDVIFESLLKSGNFADIYLAKLRSSNETFIAKSLKQNHKENDVFLMESKIKFSSLMGGQHENVLHFVGAVVSDSDIGPFIIYEYCSNGPLRDYVERKKHDMSLETQVQLLRFGLGVARGMDFLADRKIVHRRLAARNILLDSDLVPKISGFGPQPEERKDDDSQENKMERIPMKWMAPECLKSTAGATEKSDVWSFGIVLWEIFAFGESPYRNIRNRDVPSKLKGGYRLPKPKQCDDKWYDIMKQAWAEDPKKRPSFKEIRNILEEFAAAPTDDHYDYIM